MRAAFVALFMASSVCSVAFAGDKKSADSDINQGVAQRMTKEAIAAGAAGEIELRNDLLMQAATIAPNHAPAHWAQGKMEVDGEWQSIAAVQDQARSDDRLTDYNQRKAELDNSVASHLELARWCRRQGLTDEARYHWLNVLTADPDHREALGALDSVWVDGDLVSPEDAKELAEQTKKNRKIDRKWERRIAGWQRALAGDEQEAAAALADLEAVVDERAIPAFERLAEGGRRTSSADRARQLQLCQAFVSALSYMPSYEATESLVRHSVLAEDESLRTAAKQALIDRPMHECVPLLVGGLQALVESRFQIRVTPTGRVSYDHEFIVEGPEGDQVSELAREGGAVVTFTGSQTPISVQQGLARGRAVSSQHLQQFQREAAQLEQQTAATNAARKTMNERIVAVLEDVTGKSFGNSPQAWWDYWYDHNGYEARSTLPADTYRTTTSQLMEVYIEPQLPYPEDPPPPPPTPPGRCECFAAGTLVWTKTGMQPIESLAVGDLVLSMDVATGERCFRPVIGTTVRPPSGLMQLSAGSYELRTTPGHPFWVEGAGWRMAKELSEGDRVVSAEGTPLAIRHLQKFDADTQVEEEAYNLIVEGTNNYFVGQEGLLSHDNTPRRPDLVRAGKW